MMLSQPMSVKHAIAKPDAGFRSALGKKMKPKQQRKDLCGNKSR